MKKTWFEYQKMKKKHKKQPREPIFNTWSNPYPYCYTSILRDSVAPARPTEATSTQLLPLERAPGGNTWHFFELARSWIIFWFHFSFFGFFWNFPPFSRAGSRPIAGSWVQANLTVPDNWLPTAHCMLFHQKYYTKISSLFWSFGAFCLAAYAFCLVASKVLNHLVLKLNPNAKVFRAESLIRRCWRELKIERRHVFLLLWWLFAFFLVGSLMFLLI